MQKFTCTLDEVGSGDLALVGGKGANLGELVRAGLPVPQAFVVTTTAYRTFIEENGLVAEILLALEGLDYDSHAEIDARARGIRERLMAAPVDPAIEAAVRAAYARLET